MTVHDILSQFNVLFTSICVFPAICALGMYLSIRLGWPQLTRLKLSFKELIKKDGEGEGTISHYEAVSSVLAGNFGTGNISGIAVALATGGPGALVWMWVMAFFGAAIQFVSCVLGVLYRKKTNGKFEGGPMYYLAFGLGAKKAAWCFSIATICAAFTVGNFAQIHSVSLPLEQLGISPLSTGIIMMILSCLVIVGGLGRIAKIASSIVPLMAVFYLLATLYILGNHSDKILPSLSLMIRSAFDFQATAGGIMGYTVMQAVVAGFDRGLFATDAGTGIVPILQSAAKTKHPVIDGIVTLVAPFLVMTVCTATGLVIFVTGAYQTPDLQSTNMVTFAFEQGLGGKIGFYIVTISLFLFAYTTCIAWAACGESATRFLSTKYVRHYRILYIALIPFGGLIHGNLVWSLADICISLMLALNLIGIAGLSDKAITLVKEYFTKKPSEGLYTQ